MVKLNWRLDNMGIIKYYRLIKRDKAIEDSNEYDRWKANYKRSNIVETRNPPNNYLPIDSIVTEKDGRQVMYRYNLDKTELIKVCEYTEKFLLIIP